jgi:hypothetical protein
MPKVPLNRCHICICDLFRGDYQGPCFLHRACDAQGRPYQVQVGTEYLEEGYTLQATQEEAPLVFRDAEELFRWLRARGTTAGS